MALPSNLSFAEMSWSNRCSGRSPNNCSSARGIDATIECREGNAAALPVAADEQVSIVARHQGSAIRS
jgi:hypothetical protein